MTLFWLLPAAAVGHVIEEFAWPGGFPAWYRGYRPSVVSSFTARYFVAINAIFVVLCALPLVPIVQNGVTLWLAMASVIFFNAIFHIAGAIQTRRYSPGVVTSVVLYIPIAVYGYWFFLSSDETSVEQAAASFAIGPAFWLFSSFNHKRRAGKASAVK